jgi:hypothetical protein
MVSAATIPPGRTRNPVSLDSPIKRCDVDTERLCGLFLIPTATFKQLTKFEAILRASASDRPDRWNAAQCERVFDHALVHIARRDRRRAFSRVLKLANIAWPRLGLKKLNRARRRNEITSAELIEEMPEQKRNVVAALIERGDVDRDSAQAVRKVRSKATVRDKISKSFVRCGNDAKITMGVSPCADRSELTRFDCSQEFRLKHRVQTGDLIEERCAAVGFSQIPSRIGESTGVRAAHVTEQSILKHRIADRTHIERDEWPFPSALHVQRSRYEFLPGSGRALN